ncbi:MAG: hypothetical protein ACM3PC_03900 [Deltaproteobacteria bacterium]
MRIFDKLDEIFSVRLGGPSRALLLVAALALVPTWLAPLWNLTMFAPQYQDGLRLDIYSYKLEGGNKGQDIKEINVLNHYIGMRDLAAEDFTEFKWMPFVIGALALLMVRAAVFGKMANLVDVLAMFGYFGAFSLWSFAYKLYRYGHDLAPTAAVKVPPFMPPVFGRAQLANFEVYSYPAIASYAIFVSALALVAAGLVAYRVRRA